MGLVAVRGVARGFIAASLSPFGVLSFGVSAVCCFAFGACAAGPASVGGVVIGLIAIGGVAVGLLAVSLGAMGFVGAGDLAIGHYASAQPLLSAHVFSATIQDPQAIQFFNHWLPGLTHGLPAAPFQGRAVP